MNSFLLQFLFLFAVLAAVWCTPTLREGDAEVRSVREEHKVSAPLSADCVDSAGVTHKHGTGFSANDGCNSCFCNNGMMGCTLMACQVFETPTL